MGLAAGARAALLAAAAASPLRAGLDELSPAAALASEAPGPVLVELALDNLAGGGNGTAVIAVHGEWAPLGAARFLESLWTAASTTATGSSGPCRASSRSGVSTPTRDRALWPVRARHRGRPPPAGG
ncbi:unnamed protein product, partial [Prorocentrum cordatum]